ncbi:17825_t:CDS:2, partial [Racocetra persica]
EIPEFTNKYRIKRRNNGHKQYRFVSAFLYDKRKREMRFEISKKTIDRLKTGNGIQLKINKEDIKKVFDAPDGFDIEHEDIFFAMSRKVFEETGLDIKKIFCEVKYFGFDKKIFETDGIVTH